MNKGFSNVVIIVLIVLVSGLGVVGWFLNERNGVTQMPIPIIEDGEVLLQEDETAGWQVYNYKIEEGASVSFSFPSHFTKKGVSDTYFEYCDEAMQGESTSDLFFCKNGGVYSMLGVYTINENITQELVDYQGSETNYIGKSNLNNNNNDLVWIAQSGGKDDRSIHIVKNYKNNKAVAIEFYGSFYDQQNEPFRVSKLGEQILSTFKFIK